MSGVKAARLATRFLRRTPTAARCNMLHSLTTAALTPLSSFPEYVSSHKHKEKGMMDHALADMQRVVDVLHSSMGPSGRLSVAASIKLASLCLTNGNIIAAEEALKLPTPLQGYIIDMFTPSLLYFTIFVSAQISLALRIC